MSQKNIKDSDFTPNSSLMENKDEITCLDEPVNMHTANVDVQAGKMDEKNQATIIRDAAAKGKSSLPPLPRKQKKVTPIPSIEKPRLTSEIWIHFTRMESDKSRSSCNYCGTTYAAGSKSNGTSAMWTHFNERCLKNPYKLSGQTTLDKYQDKKEENNSLNKPKKINLEELRHDVAIMVITDELPFKFVEGEGFRRLMGKLEPNFLVPSRLTVARDCMKIYLDEQGSLKRILKNERICLTTDTWSSIQNLNYMCLTAHWVGADWKLHKRILNFCQVPNHKGETIGKYVEDCLNYWGIDKIFTLTVDNASSNDGAIRYLKRKTKDWTHTIASHEFLHVRCCAHIINLIVKDGLEEQNDSIVKIRNAVRYVRSSPSRLESFKSCVEREKIESKSLVCLDVETRWNSTYLMLDYAEKFEKAFERLEEEDARFSMYFLKGDEEENEEGSTRKRKVKGCKYFGPPTFDDWEKARYFVKFLKVFYNVTLKFSGSLYVTANAFFHEFVAVQTQLLQLTKSGDNYLRSMAMRMRIKFEKYWGNLDNINFTLFVAVVLDPRYKTKYVKFCLTNLLDDDVVSVNKDDSKMKKVDVMMDKIEASLNCLYDHYAKIDASIGFMDNKEKNCGDIMDVDQIDDARSFIESQFEKHLEELQTVESKSEVTKYLSDACEKITNSFDLLEWWKVNAAKYPILSQVARDVMAVQVSTVASESSFSTGGRILDPFRSSLSPKMVQALVCTQQWLRSSPDKIDLEEIAEELKAYEAIEKENAESISLNVQGLHDVDG